MLRVAQQHSITNCAYDSNNYKTFDTMHFSSEEHCYISLSKITLKTVRMVKIIVSLLINNAL